MQWRWHRHTGCKGCTGLSYQLESAPSPAGMWSNVTAVTADAGGLLQHIVPMTGGAAFFRFTYTPPTS
ncbi:MAG: hypothetical protein R3F13_06420 [Prosthecobacter sp.]